MWINKKIGQFTRDFHEVDTRLSENKSLSNPEVQIFIFMSRKFGFKYRNLGFNFRMCINFRDKN